MSDIPTLYPPVEVQRQLGVSASGLRRLARIYESVLGELPRDSAGGRLWPDEAVRRLGAARVAVEAGRAKSVSEALGSPVVTLGESLPSIPEPDQGAVMVAVLEELRSLRSEIGELKEQQRALLPSIDVEAPATRSELRGGLWARLRRRLVELLEP